MIMQLFLLDLCRIEICTGAKILLLSWNKTRLISILVGMKKQTRYKFIRHLNLQVNVAKSFQRESNIDEDYLWFMVLGILIFFGLFTSVWGFHKIVFKIFLQ